MNLETLLASRTKMMGTNAIREILKVVSQPGMISLAGGIPAPESFPMEIIGELTKTILWKFGSKAFQYDPTEGFGPLREALAEHLKMSGIKTSANEILIGSGSQGVLDSIGKVLISKGDKIAEEKKLFTRVCPNYVQAVRRENLWNARR